jgi:hypothetical protein
MEGIRGCWLKRLLAFGLIFMLIFGSMVLSINTIAIETQTTRTGNISNQPITGFSEGNETIRIHNDTGIHKTWYKPLENITINISSDVVNYQPVGPQKVNKVIITDYTGNIEDEYPTDAFFQQPGGPPYYYNMTFQAPLNEDHYLIEVHIKEGNNQPGRNQFMTWDVIQVGNGSDPMKNMTTYSEPDCVTPDWVFGNADTVYIKVYTPNTTDPADSDVTFADYMGNDFAITIEDLLNYTVVQIENDSVIAFDMLNDLELDNFPDQVLKGNYWYTVSVDLKNMTGEQMANGWAAQIQILPPPIITETACDPVEIFANSTNTTTLWTLFSDEDSVNASNFTVTFKVRDPNNDEIILIENETNGNGGLTITELGNNSYNASYTWDPQNDAVLGDYDLYAMVFDDQNGYAEDEFNNNRNELTLLHSGVPPKINISNTTCEPAKINIMKNEMVTFIANFSDDNDPPVNINDFTLTFKIRYENNDQTIIAQNKKMGNPGDVAGSGDVLLTNYDPGLYSATITWNPPMTQAQGKYDLFFSVSTLYGTATDGFNNNPDELEIYSTGHPPDLDVGNTTCFPTSVDIVSRKMVTIYCEFSDADDPEFDVFNVTFKIRPPNDKMSDAITLVDNKANGGSGEFGGVVEVDKQTAGKYMASYDWVPPYWMDLGKYDLYFMVIDEWDNIAEDPFAQNQDELELTSSVEPPNIDAGDTICLPSSVNKIGNGTTEIFCEFSDSNFFNVTDFNITFKLRDPDDNEIVLVDNKAVGSSGEDPNQKTTVEITYSGTVFTASYEWDPPLTAAVGKYDLYFAVMNLDGGFAKDKFEDNTDELDIVTTGYAPEIVETTCKPKKITIKGPETTTITAKFTDEDNPSPKNFTVTFKIRGPKDNDTEIVLVNDKASNSTGELGGTVLVTNTTEGYTASIDWNPDNTVKPGKYDLYFSVKDELTFEAIDQFDNNLNELELITEVPSEEPELDHETPTKDGNTYTFKITYSDPNNNPPNDQGVLLFIGVFTHKMLESDLGDDNYTDGKEYYYTIDLEEGEVQYKFKVTNSKNLTYETEMETITVEPEDKPDDDEDESNYFGIAVALIIIIIILLLLYFLFFKSKKPEPEEKEKEPPVAQPVPEHEPGEPAPPMAKTVSEPEEGVEEEGEEGEEPKEAEVAEEGEEGEEGAGAQEPVEEEPTAEEPVAEEPAAEEPVEEEPTAEEPVAEEPVAEEPVAEEPVTEEPAVEESKVTEQTAEQEPKPETEAEKPQEPSKQE